MSTKAEREVGSRLWKKAVEHRRGLDAVLQYLLVDIEKRNDLGIISNMRAADVVAATQLAKLLLAQLEAGGDSE